MSGVIAVMLLMAWGPAQFPDYGKATPDTISAIAEYHSCAIKKAYTLEKSGENGNDIAQAALSACKQARSRVNAMVLADLFDIQADRLDAAAKAADAGRPDSQNNIADMLPSEDLTAQYEANLRDEIISAIAEVRSGNLRAQNQ